MMTGTEMATLLAKVQLGDNRHVDELTIAYWLDTIGDLTLEAALVALRRWRREHAGEYLEPGHLLELAGVDETPNESAALPDHTAEVLETSKMRGLAALGYTIEQYDADETIRADVARRWSSLELEA